MQFVIIKPTSSSRRCIQHGVILSTNVLAARPKRHQIACFLRNTICISIGRANPLPTSSTSRSRKHRFGSQNRAASSVIEWLKFGECASRLVPDRAGSSLKKSVAARAHLTPFGSILRVPPSRSAVQPVSARLRVGCAARYTGWVSKRSHTIRPDKTAQCDRRPLRQGPGWHGGNGASGMAYGLRWTTCSTPR